MTTSRKFFLVSQVFYPDETSTASLFTDLALALAREPDISVEVWCAQPTYSTTQRQQSKVVFKDVTIRYLGSTNFPKSNLFGRLINYVTFSLSLCFKILFSRDKTPIFTVTNPPFLGVLIFGLCIIKRRQYVYIVLDVYPDGLVRLGRLSQNGLIVRIWSFFNKLVLRSAGKIIIIGRDMHEWVRTTEPSAELKIEYIPHWQNEELISPADFESNAFVREHGFRGEFVVQYAGNMGMWHDMKSLALAAEALENQGVFFCFIGDGIRRKDLFDTWQGRIPSNILVLPFQPKERIGQFLTACHAALISLRGGLEGIAVPCKLYGILASGVPVIAQVPEPSEIALAVKEDKCGIVVPPGDAEALVKAIIYLKEHTEIRKEMAVNARRAFENKYTTKQAAKRYRELIEAVE